MLLKTVVLLGAVALIVKPSSATSKGLAAPLVVTSILDTPFLSLRETSTDGPQYEGYCADLLEELAHVIGFNYTLKLVADGRYGRRLPNGTWNGMIGELVEGDADMAVSSLTITRARAAAIEFSRPYMNLGISVMIKKPQIRPEFSGDFFLYPFSMELWFVLLVTCLAIRLALFVLDRYATAEKQKQSSDELTSGDADGNRSSLSNRVWLRSLFQRGTTKPRSISGRVLNATWCLFVVFIAAMYIANLAIFMYARGDTNTMRVPVTSVEDLAEQTEIQYGTIEGGSTYEFFRQSTDPIYEKMWKFMSSAKPSVFVSSAAEGVAKVRQSKGKYAFLMESTMNDYVNQRNPCDTMRVGQLLDSKGYGIAMKAGSPLINQINLALMEFSESGFLARLQKKWWFENGECAQPRGVKGTGPLSSSIAITSLPIRDVTGLFYLLIAGIILAFIIGVIEYVCARRKKSNP